MQKGSVAYRSLAVNGRAAVVPGSVSVRYALVTCTEVPSRIVENLTSRELIAWLASRGLLPAGAAFEEAVFLNLRVRPRRVPVE